MTKTHDNTYMRGPCAILACRAAKRGNTWGSGHAESHLAESAADAAERARDAALARVQSATTAISRWSGRQPAPASYWAELTAAHRELRRCESELAGAMTRRNIAWGQVPSRQWAAVPRTQRSS
jgi:hypothetical protein